MVDITPVIDDVIEIEKLLNLLGISPDDQAKICDGEIDYNLYTLSNLDDGDKDLLIKIGFEKFKENVFVIERDVFKTTEIIDCLIPMYTKKEIELWDEIIDMTVGIHEKKAIFRPTFKQMKITNDWKGKLICNEDQLKSLINDLCLLFRESCKEGNIFSIPESCLSHKFWKTIGDLRNHYFFHDPEHRGSDKYKESIERANKASEYLFADSAGKKTSVDFMKAQFRLLYDCLDFLNTVRGDADE